MTACSRLAKMSIPVTIKVFGDKPVEPWRQIYRFFGSDEINYVYMKDGQKLLSKLGSLGQIQVFFRAHSQFVTGEGIHALKWGSTNVYTEDEHGNPVYDWTIIDRVYDTYLANKVKPYVQFGFMPKALSTHPEPYKHKWTPTAPYDEIFTGWAYPPTDYAKWGDLIYQWTKHCLNRYGISECQSWYWATWNEPDIGYWQGTPEEYNTLYDYAVEGVRRALPSAKVGGPETTGRGPEYLRGFLEHCLHGENQATKGKGSPIDFVAFHAKGSPTYREDTKSVRMDVAHHLREIDASFDVIASFSEFKPLPVVLGESDPEGAAAAQGPELAYRNGTLYSSYTAASFARKHLLAEKHGVNLEGVVTWAFEFEDQPYFAGFRVLASNDVDLPVLNIFRMFARMEGERLDTYSSRQVPLDKLLQEGVRGDADVGAIASRNGNTVCVFVWHYHDDDLEGPSAAVELTLEGVSWNSSSKLLHYRVDHAHSNSYTEWQAMGSPQQPTAEQYAKLQAAGSLAQYSQPTKVDTQSGAPRLLFDLPRQGVSLLVLDGV